MADESNNPEIHKVIGAPGTGKTTRVVGNPELPDVTSLVMENLKEVPFEQQMIVTYTKAGTEEAADRLEKILDVPRYKIDDRVRTIHSQCYHALGVDQDQVVNWWHKQNFCDKYDLDYGNEDDSGDIMSSESDEGHAMFQIYGWLKSNRKPLEEHNDCPVPFPGDDSVLELMKRWEEYKDENDLIQFSDMIEMVVKKGKHMLHEEGYPNLFGDNPQDEFDTFRETRFSDRFNGDEWRDRGPFIDARILYVDEVQDLTPLQWSWYLMQKLVCEEVYIGGDDDQTIYGWAGANPDFMLDEEGTFEVLDKTYRIPEDIWEVCDGVIEQVDKRQEKDVTPHGEGGEFITMHSPSPKRVAKHLKDGSCMVILRANYMVTEFGKKLQEQGIPYDNMSTFDTWTDEITTLRDALAKLKNGDENLSKEEVEILKDYALKECESCQGRGCRSCGGEGEVSFVTEGNGYDNSESAMASFGGVPQERVMDLFDMTDRYSQSGLTWKNYLTKCNEINYYQKNALKQNIRKGNEHLYPERVRIGTIHSSKGKEAETVVVGTDSTQTILENMQEDVKDKPDKKISDAERRLYYVGMTRASEKLVLAQGIISPESAIPMKQILADSVEIEKDQSEWVVQDSGSGNRWG